MEGIKTDNLTEEQKFDIAAQANELDEALAENAALRSQFEAMEQKLQTSMQAQGHNQQILYTDFVALQISNTIDPWHDSIHASLVLIQIERNTQALSTILFRVIFSIVKAIMHKNWINVLRTLMKSRYISTTWFPIKIQSYRAIDRKIIQDHVTVTTSQRSEEVQK